MISKDDVGSSPLDSGKNLHYNPLLINPALLGGGFHHSAMTASTSLMVPKEQLTRVAGMNQTLHGLLNVFGAPLGALLMELLQVHGGPTWALLQPVV